MTLLLYAIALVVLFQVAVALRVLGVDSGSRWRDHSTLILLVAVPLPPESWGWVPQLQLFTEGVVWFWRVFGLWAFLDDTYQHWVIGRGQKAVRENGGVDARMYYHSPLHRWGMAWLSDLWHTAMIVTIILTAWGIVAGLIVGR